MELTLTMKRFIAALCFFLFTFQAAANADDQRDFGLLLDKDFSPYTGSELFISTLRAYQITDDSLIGNTTDNNSFGMALGRFAKYAFLEGTLASWSMVAQHEVFGHGFRAREAGLSVQSYCINPFSGSTSFLTADYNKLNQHQKIALATGGVESTTILAGQIRQRWLQNETIDSRESVMYLLNMFDQTQYVISASNDSDFVDDGHDIKAYIKLVNGWHNNTDAITENKLRSKILIDFADPFLYFSLYGMATYIVTGQQDTTYPTINIKGYRYLPALRARLAPWGPEYQWLNFIKTPSEKLIEVTLRHGKTGNITSYGGTLSIHKLLDFYPWTIDGLVEFWRQPTLFTSSAAASKHKVGGAIMGGLHYHLTDKTRAYVKLGYKQKGYMYAEPLKASALAKTGFSTCF